MTITEAGVRVGEELDAVRAELAALFTEPAQDDPVIAARVEAAEARLAVLERAVARYQAPPGDASG